MVDKVIVFERNGSISLLWPSEPYPVEEVAKKDVPVGTPYLIINASDIPQDPAFRSAWVVDFSNPTGYGQGYSDVINKMVAEKMGSVPERPDIKEEDKPWPMV
jgi:hypothetical protein